MNEQNNNLIDIPLEFKIACTVHNLDVVEVLQSFVSHVSYYLIFSHDFIKGYRDATNAIAEFNNTHRADHDISSSIINNREYCHKRMKEIFGLTVLRQPPAKKRLKSEPLVKKLLKGIAISKTTDKIYLDEESVIHLNADFRILCELFSVYPKEYLEYFMSKISLADHSARGGLMLYVENPSLAFFLRMTEGIEKPRMTRRQLTETDINFIDRIQELNVELFIYRRLEQRIEIFREVYLDYYNNKTN